MSSDKAKRPDPSEERPVAGQPAKKLTLFEQIIKKTAKVLRQSR